MPDEKALFQQATQHFKNKEFDQAVKIFQEALRVKLSEEALCGLGLVYAFQNRFEDARQTFEKALQLNPNNPSAKNALDKVNQQLDEFQRITAFYQDLKPHLPKPAKSRSLTSLIVITYNQLYYTRLCLESLFATTDQPYELVLVDNASTDGTGAYFLGLEKDKHALSPHLKGLYLCLNAQNKGFAAAVNQGLRQGKGDVLVVLNNDLLFTPRWLGLLLDQMEKNHCPLLGPICNDTTDVLLLPQLIPTPYPNTDSMLNYLQAANPRVTYSPTDWIAGFCMLIHRDVINKIGYFDEAFGLGFCEDEDYCYRARHAGFSVGYATVFVHHYWHKSFGQLDSSQQNQRAQENLYYLLNKMIRLNPQDPQAHYRLADHYAFRNQLEKAELHYTRCLQNQPDHTDALYNLGVLYHKIQQPEKARETFQKLLHLQPNHPGAQKALTLLS